MEVNENGMGISVRQIIHSKSLGLIGIRERASLLHGKVEIHGTQGRGTSVTISIPLEGQGKTTHTV